MENIPKYFLIAFLAGLVARCHAKCHEYYGGGVTDPDEILYIHNYYRSLVMHGEVPGQPRGIRIRPIKWLDELAKSAQVTADSCELETKQLLSKRFVWVGENMGFTYSPFYTSEEPDWPSILEFWFEEHEDYYYPNPPDSYTAHYLQIVWDDTIYVGCGYSYFYNKDDPEEPYTKLYVCNYAPGGLRKRVPYSLPKY